jgi:hypothetical protein
MLYWGAVLIEAGAVWLLVHGYAGWVIAGVTALSAATVLLLDWILERRGSDQPG